MLSESDRLGCVKFVALTLYTLFPRLHILCVAECKAYTVGLINLYPGCIESVVEDLCGMWVYNCSQEMCESLRISEKCGRLIIW